jgi:hypothetical protein
MKYSLILFGVVLIVLISACVGHKDIEKELIFSKQETLSIEDKKYDVLHLESIEINGREFVASRWLLYVDNDDTHISLGADGLMSTWTIRGTIESKNGLLYLKETERIDSTMERLDGTRDIVSYELIKCEIDHELQEYWFDKKTGRLFLNKKYYRKK